MEHSLNKSLKLLDKYFKENSKDFIENEINEISKLKIQGVSFNQYLKSFSTNYKIDTNIIISESWDTSYESNVTETIVSESKELQPIKFTLSNELQNGFNSNILLDSAA